MGGPAAQDVNILVSHAANDPSVVAAAPNTTGATAGTAKEDLMRQEVSRDLEASKPLSEQARLTTDPTPVMMSQSGTTIIFNPSSLTVTSGEQVKFKAAETLSGTLTVPSGMFTASGSFGFGQGGDQLFTVASPPTQKFVNVGFENTSQNANGTITVGTGNGPTDPGELD